MATTFHLLGGLLIHSEDSPDGETLNCVASFGFPLEPFNGAERASVEEAAADCKKHPVPHFHSLKGSGLPAIARRFGHWPKESVRVAFVPFQMEEENYFFLGFKNPEHDDFEFTPSFYQLLARTTALVAIFRRERELSQQLIATEKYVREVGHDFASSIQAIIAKTKLLRDGRVPSAAIKKKVLEIEAEVRGAAMIADQLELTVNAEYQLQSKADFNLVSLIREAILYLTAEAAERKIQFSFQPRSPSLILWGDARAIQKCVEQLAHNAIKYAFGSSVIKIDIGSHEDYAWLAMANIGHGLPKGADQKRIWEFGFRGAEAKELHVNGSGVGLFTVKKIVLAHHGTVKAEQKGDLTVFRLNLPTKEHLKKLHGVFL
jgi:signal transduction histidine kinase